MPSSKTFPADLKYFKFLGGIVHEETGPRKQVSFKSVPEPVLTRVAMPQRAISNNPHACDLTYFTFLGGIVQDKHVRQTSNNRFKIPTILKLDKRSSKRQSRPASKGSTSSGGSSTDTGSSTSIPRPTTTPRQPRKGSTTSGLMNFIKKARTNVFTLTNPSARITVVRENHTAIQDLMMVEHFADWFTTVSGEEVRADHFCEDLQDGTILCHIMQQIPNSGMKKYFQRADMGRMGEFRKRENIQKFGKACKKVGIRGTPVTYADLKKKNVHHLVPILVELAKVVYRNEVPIGDTMPEELRA